MDWTAVFGEESDSLLTDPHLSRGDTEGLSFPDKPEPLFLETSSRSTPLDLLVFSSQLLQLSLKSFILICYKSVEQRIPRSRHSGGHSDWFYESVERFFFFLVRHQVLLEVMISFIGFSINSLCSLVLLRPTYNFLWDRILSY